MSPIFANGAISGAIQAAMAGGAQQEEGGVAREENTAFTPREGETATGTYGLFSEYAGDPTYEAVYKLGVQGNKLSVRGHEYGAFGGTDADGNLVFQGLSSGRSGRMSEATLTEQAGAFRAAYSGGTVKYSFHTHGNDFDNPGGFENFSPTDRSFYSRNPIVGRVTGFLATPQGLLLMNDPSTGMTTQIGRVPAVRKPIGR